jgi:hypothetical protein
VQTDDEGRGDRDDVGHYEQLRRHALEGDASGWRMGLGVLHHRGVAAWARTLRTTVLALPAPVLSSRAPVDVGADVVAVLAEMALGCIAAE